MKLKHGDPLNYNPTLNGLPKAALGLKKLPKEPETEQQKFFQFDENFYKYRETKEEARAENQLHKYYQTMNVDNKKACQHIIKLLSTQNSEHFTLKEHKLYCHLTDEELHFDYNYNLLDSSKTAFQYQDLFDALGMQVSEDIIVHTFDGDKDFASAIHLFSPNGWSANGAINWDLDTIHKGVPYINKVIRNTHRVILSVLKACVGFERVGAINFYTNSELNRHEEKGVEDYRDMDGLLKDDDMTLYMRYERQTVSPVSSQSFLFTVKTYMLDTKKLSKENINNILKSIDTDMDKLNSKGFFDTYYDQAVTYFKKLQRG